MTHRNSISPIFERIVLLDVLRGFALFGIYISIIHGFNYCITYDGEIFDKYSFVDLVIDNLTVLVISKRFIGMFSLLFGIGIAIQYGRFRDRGFSFYPYFIKRMVILAIFGLVNTTFFWWGEILLIYSIVGLLMLFVVQLPHRWLVVFALFFFVCWHPFYEYLLLPFFQPDMQRFVEQYPFELVQQIYTEGTLFEMARLRWLEYKILLTQNSFHMGMSISMVLLGFVIGERSWHRYFIENCRNFKVYFIPALFYSLIFVAYGMLRLKANYSIHDGALTYSLYLLFLLSSLLVYVYLITAWYTRGGGILSQILANNGRLSLSGYMGAAMTYAFIFHAYGFGWYTRFAAIGQLVIALVIYTMFSIFSHFWLKHFQFGPLEWIYRRISYGHPLLK